jgi:hypothetical protein
MKFSESAYCLEFLLDLIGYEMLRGTLSPEMGYLFQKHLEQCDTCRYRVVNFYRVLGKPEMVQNVN